MRKFIFFATFLTAGLMFLGCARTVKNLTVDEARGVMSWEVSRRGRLTEYEFRGNAFGDGRLTATTRGAFRTETRSVNATMGEIRQSPGRLTFRINGTTYVYRPSGGPRTTAEPGRAAVTDPTSPFVGALPALEWFTDIGSVTVQTRDGRYSIEVAMSLGFDQGDQAASSELFARRHELRDFTRRYFSNLNREDLLPDNESRLQREIMDLLNTRYLNNARIRSVAFPTLDVHEN